MPTDRDVSTVREAVGVFNDAKTLEDAIDRLLESGFDRADLSLLAAEHAIEEKLGHLYSKVNELEDEANAPRAAYISTNEVGDAEGAAIGTPMYIAAVTAAGLTVAAGGPLVAAITALAAGGGGGAVIGGLFARLIGKHHATYLERQLEHGGILLWVRTWTPEQEETAKKVLSEFSAHDVHVHEYAA